MDYQGFGVSSGVASAVLFDTTRKENPTTQVVYNCKEKERLMLQLAFSNLNESFRDLYQWAVSLAGRAVGLLIEGHRCMAADESYQQQIYDLIDGNQSAEEAVLLVTERITASMLNSTDRYLKARIKDFYQVSKLLIQEIKREKNKENTSSLHSGDVNMQEYFIIYGLDFSLEEILLWARKGAVGFLDGAGEEESHAVMIAKALNLPMIVQCLIPRGKVSRMKVRMDGSTGVVRLE